MRILLPSLVVLVLAALFLISCGGGTTTSSLSTGNPNQIGTATSSSITCPVSTANPPVAGTCVNLTVSSCAGVANFSPILLKITAPAGTSQGTVIFTTGGNGIPLYEDLMIFGSTAINAVVNNGFTVVQTAFQGGSTGWLTGPAADGPLTLVCRWTTMAQWVHDNVRAATEPLCATGNSAGAGAIAYALSRYGQDAIFNFVLPTSGPPFSRIDQGCICNGTQLPTTCAGQQDPCYGNNANMFLDPAYGNTHCSAGDTADAALWKKDSILSSDGRSKLSYSTRVHFIYGGLDLSSGVAEAALWENAITSQHSSECVADAPHEIADVLDGAMAVANNLTAQCH